MSTKRKLPSKLAAPVVKPARTPSKQILSEARAVVTGSALDLDSPSVQLNGSNHLDLTHLSSDNSSSDDDEDEDPANFHAEGPTDDADDISMADAAEPSFGDLIFAHTSEPISVSSSFPATKTASSALAAPSGASLGVALSQALKTSDHALLESCLQTSDLPTIRATIQRLAAPLATPLLSLLAGRLHRRPGRAGSLMVWIQWTLVTHGGYLATQPQVVAKLAELNRVIEERARGLQGLLALKGKLDLLDAQMQLRKSVREARMGEEEEEDEDVVYVEGEESEAEAVEGKSKKLKRSEEFGDSESEMSDDMPDTLGDRIIADSDDEEEDSDDEGGLLDDEAEETDDDSGDDEEEVDFDDADEDEEDSDDAAAATPVRSSKMAKVNGMFGKSR
ncbi:Small subunit (SSU) processome component [Pseudogymnoascus destructans]|uniref:Small-subunit processome Utp12 domain-containing protein n=2 Tax=Pseudogymnoascus destructans TaxID=655981 RepID=L8FT03_PSED2|nr:Small subunit (SSU) processome component [Pseudogymnoascus destructans]ELR03593.1 hypothetical protein GMDG_06247 [Pseudogymnoascus destructans 20631-21]OAF59560.1 Small subunit (SSU) processome component [Pseudogymnoascus destructans]